MDLTLPGLDQLLQSLSSWRDVLDVFLVTFVLYNLLLLIQGTRSVQILIGILGLVGVYYIAGVFNLRALERTLQGFFIILPVAVIVLFQHEIRRALANFGRTPLWGFSNPQTLAGTFNEIVLAATTLSERKIGALIVMERLEGLRDYIENGIQVDAIVSVDLLINLFTPDTPTHDGAVIIQNGRLAAATCFLPLSQNQELSTELGTRHRAALGISEETDALAVIVSEETGTIAIAFGGQIIRPLESRELRTLLYKYLVTELHSWEAEKL